jgi:hypothetical protein
VGKETVLFFIKKYGPDFSGENFCVLKEKEHSQFNEYRTRRLGLGGLG